MVVSCDIPVQVWMLFSTAPNLRGLFWKGIGPPGPLAPCRSISIRPTALRHIIHCLPLITVWKYQGQGSHIPLGASVGVLALRACVCHCLQCAECSSHDGLGYQGKRWIPQHFFPLCSSRTAHPWPAAGSTPVLGVQMVCEEPLGKYRERVAALIVSV